MTWKHIVTGMAGFVMGVLVAARPAKAELIEEEVPPTRLLYRDDFGPVGRFFSGITGDSIKEPLQVKGERLKVSLDVWPAQQYSGKSKQRTDILVSRCYGGGVWGIYTSEGFNTDRSVHIYYGWVNGRTEIQYITKRISVPLTMFDWNRVELSLDRLSGKVEVRINGAIAERFVSPIGRKLNTTGFAIGEDCIAPFKGFIRNVRIYEE